MTLAALRNKFGNTIDRRRCARILRTFGPVLALFAVWCGFALVAPPSFSSLRNVETILRQASIVGMAALGMTVVIVAGGIDLSVGSLVALCTVLIAAQLESGSGSLSAVVVTLLCAAAAGLLNGFLVSRLAVGPFIVTLGTLLIFRGLAKGIAAEQKIDAPQTGLNDLLATLPSDQRWLLVPAGVWLTVVLAVLLWLMLHWTKLGRQIFAVGSNARAARMCGIEVARVQLIVFMIGGLFAGLAGMLQFSRLTVGDPTVAIGLELDVIAAVVIGGGSLAGGEGSVTGSLVGALLMTVIRSGCAQLGLQNWIQEITTGIVIIAAVCLDRFRRQR